LIDPIAKLVETVWKETGLSQEFSGSLKQALFFSSSDHDPRKTHVRRLPEVCCQAAGGDPALAGPVSAAWLIFNRAAHIMDSVQDGDVPEPWWDQRGPGFALNVASAFYFTASKILDELEGYGISSRSAGAIRNTFSRLLLQMCEGQHLDLTATKTALDEYWRIVNLKSGLFFAIGCRSGAELVLNDTIRLDGFEIYGKEIGLIIQLLDDLEEFQINPETGKLVLDLSGKNLSLPLSYAYSMLPDDQQMLLSEKIEQAKFDPDAVQSVLTMLDHIGVASYMSLEIARHASLALDGLEQARPIETTRETLEDLVNALIK
jgi:geranylgeranyl diphosphate synthase, type I